MRHSKPKVNKPTIFYCPNCETQQSVQLPKNSTIGMGIDGFIEFYISPNGDSGFVMCPNCYYRRG